ncbi:transposase family protein [Streptomyces triculaminicus]|uniref:transposase family protein n=1 Tax=Streptomyces triculaminicus TaxID=2816232 RepID=UPI0037CD942C
MPTVASSPIPLAFDQLRERPGAVPGEIPGLLERLAEVSDPRDPRGVRHALVVMPALTACAVLAGATSLPAVGEWITDAPPSVLECLGVRPHPPFPRRCLPAEATVRRLLGRIDGDAWLPPSTPHVRARRRMATSTDLDAPGRRTPDFGPLTRRLSRNRWGRTLGVANVGARAFLPPDRASASGQRNSETRFDQ